MIGADPGGWWRTGFAAAGGARAGIGTSTVARAVAQDVPPTYELEPAPTSFSLSKLRCGRCGAVSRGDGDRGAVRAGRADHRFRDNARRLRPEHHRPDTAGRLSNAANTSSAMPSAAPASLSSRWSASAIPHSPDRWGVQQHHLRHRYGLTLRPGQHRDGQLRGLAGPYGSSRLWLGASASGRMTWARSFLRPAACADSAICRRSKKRGTAKVFALRG
jgi:hypothetical protein